MIVDGYSRYTWVFFQQVNSEVASTFKKFVEKAQNEFEVKINKTRSDNRKNFDNTNIVQYCDNVGIKHKISTTYIPQQNVVVERKNHILIALVRTIL
jgi:transposase InsO family protein